MLYTRGGSSDDSCSTCFNDRCFSRNPTLVPGGIDSFYERGVRRDASVRFKESRGGGNLGKKKKETRPRFFINLNIPPVTPVSVQSSFFDTSFVLSLCLSRRFPCLARGCVLWRQIEARMTCLRCPSVVSWSTLPTSSRSGEKNPVGGQRKIQTRDEEIARHAL